MNAFDFIILYVASATDSARFYEKLLGAPPAEASPGFAMFPLPSGIVLGLWTRGGVKPAPAAQAGASELCWPVGSRSAVEELAARWEALGVSIIQKPTMMDFGYTAAAVDPDGHRLRIFCTAQD